MKSYFFKIIILAALIFNACDKIEEEERWKILKNNGYNDNMSTLLIEKYTGQQCINCPEAAKLLHKQTKPFGDNVIIVSMHPPRSGMSQIELASANADKYAEYFKHERAVPGIMLNRKNLNNNEKYSQTTALWAANIRNIVTQKPEYKISFNEINLLNDNKKISVEVKAASITDKKNHHKINMQLWIVEDIRAKQITFAGTKKDYFHHNVFRDALNGLWGKPYQLSSLYKEEINVPASIKDVNNAKVIAFIFDADTKQILASAIKPLGDGIKPNDEENNGSDEPNIPIIDSENIYFAIGENIIKSGNEIKITHADKFGKDAKSAQMHSPSLYIMPGEKYGLGEYKLIIKKENYLDDNNCGLEQVCAEGHCVPVEDINKYEKNISIKYKKANYAQALSIHYFVKNNKINQQNKYKVRVSFYKNEKEIAYLIFIFDFDPNNVEEL